MGPDPGFEGVGNKCSVFFVYLTKICWNMKKLICASMALLLVLSAYGQDKKNEISMTYSQFTVPQFGYIFGGVFGIMLTGGYFDFENPVMPGCLGVEYNHWVNNWFGYGGSLLGEYMTADTYSKDSSGNKTKDGVYNLGYVSVMPTVRFRWFNNPHFGMYSKLGAGVGLGITDECKLTFAAQISPVCMDFGGESLRGFMELGVGMQGILAVGIKKMF